MTEWFLIWLCGVFGTSAIAGWLEPEPQEATVALFLSILLWPISVTFVLFSTLRSGLFPTPPEAPDV